MSWKLLTGKEIIVKPFESSRHGRKINLNWPQVQFSHSGSAETARTKIFLSSRLFHFVSGPGITQTQHSIITEDNLITRRMLHAGGRYRELATSASYREGWMVVAD